ncbi:MAG: hypothetical protein FD181_2678 [Prolixibacteraceae bacterium]|nr:MAG: hypothetical protein FD181_2678 [Prolixibacteraceae bacterium]
MSDKVQKQNNDNFVVYGYWYDPVKGLTVEQKAEILDAMFQYNMGLTMPELSTISNIVFQFMKPVFDKNRDKYNAICERNRGNGEKGGRPKNPNKPKKPSGYSGNPKNPDEPKKANNDNDIKNDKNDNLSKHDFMRFWDLYDKKSDKEKCFKKWNSLNSKDIETIFKNLPEYIKSTPDKQFRKNPFTYLNGKCWNNEVIYSNHNKEKSEQSEKYTPEWVKKERAIKANGVN